MVNGDLGDWNKDYSYDGFYQYNGKIVLLAKLGTHWY